MFTKNLSWSTKTLKENLTYCERVSYILIQIKARSMRNHEKSIDNIAKKIGNPLKIKRKKFIPWDQIGYTNQLLKIITKALTQITKEWVQSYPKSIKRKLLN